MKSVVDVCCIFSTFLLHYYELLDDPGNKIILAS